MDILKELKHTRQRWQKAHDSGDKIMEGLWLRYGLKLREDIDKKYKNSAENDKRL